MSYLVAIMWVAPIFPLLYVVLRWRAGDRYVAGAGTHAALLYFATVALLVGLAGAANLTYGAISITPPTPAMTRLSWGLLVGSVIFCLLNIVLLRALGPLRDPNDVVRVFIGFVMVVAGMVAMVALILMLIEVFRKTEDDAARTLRSDQIRLFGSWTLFFLVTFLLTTRVLARNALEARGGMGRDGPV